MYKVGNLGDCSWYRNAHRDIINRMAFWTHIRLETIGDAYTRVWKEEHNVTFEHDLIAVFESEEDFICFKLKWS